MEFGKDLDIGKDFLSSWKSMSTAQGDEMDFDLTPVTQGNKKSFDFDKADMDFNLDGDFGKIPSFNMDISDLDISLPLKKNGKSKEKPEESSTGKDKGKNDRFAFAFDFDELENFSFESSLTKEEPKAQKDKNNKGSSPNGSGCQDKEGSMHMNLLEHVNLEDRPMKPSLPGTADLESTREICLPNLAMDDAVTAEQASAVEDAASDKTKSLQEATVASRELPKISPSEKLIFPEPVDLQASTGNDVMQDLSSDSLSKNEPGGETDDGAKSPVVVEDHVRGNRERTEPGQANSLVANSRTTSAVPGISCDTPSGREKQEPASEICKLPLVRDWDNNQSDRKLVSLPLQHSKPPLRRELSRNEVRRA
ncbi:hypothetical protein Sango_0830700 [Sesamum angolense]|uniref:Uncharacterized protein n=1 Tax=Sesamum angolense TaxID=2727404 RepID=A0AAE1X3V6_9LAMI|nr:hypothetical protein Sango_0830700 [Sesamum angolense]